MLSADLLRPLRFVRLTGSGFRQVFDDLARLRIDVFCDFPYLYEGTIAYEKEYIETYARADRSLLFAVYDGDRMVGATTALPLRDETDEVQQPFRDAGYDLDTVFYFGESLLLPEYRGRGLGHRFFDEREAHARQFGQYTTACFCAVQRPDDHPLRPVDYQPHDAFWTKRGYQRATSLQSLFWWPDRGEITSTAKPMVYWMRGLYVASANITPRRTVVSVNPMQYTMETTVTSRLSEDREIGLGVIGMGGFGLFAVQQFVQTPNVKLVAIAGSSRDEAHRTAKRFGAAMLGSLEELVNHPDVNVVYIATPPFMHYEQAMLALNAGKHVICEKPLAMNPEQGREMVETAKRKGLLMVTNLMQRYNPMFARIKHLIDKKLLGEFLHGYFENYAGDEGLSPEHWFWDRQKSGGIFIEHGVHFFDMFAGWLGDGKVVAAQLTKRPNSQDIEDQVQATVEYGDDKTGKKHVNFYHGFTQTGRMDRQEMRLLFERGDITLHEWVPTRMVLRCVADEETTRELTTLFPGAQLNVTANIGGKDQPLRGRHKEFNAYQQIELRFGFEQEKQHLYSELLRLMFRDQISGLKYPQTHRIITEDNGLRSLETAAEADRLARQ